MKQVLPPTQTTTIPFDELTRIKNPLVGLLTEENKKITLIPTSFGSDTYFARAVEAWEQGNSYGRCPDRQPKSVEEWCKFFIETNNAQIFLFDNPKELFKWLSE